MKEKTALSICAFSDPHGQLPVPSMLKKTDVVAICGDIVDLYVQRNDLRSRKWFEDEFKNWADQIDGKIVIIGGNHDFWLYREGKERNKEFFNKLCPDKVFYLEDEFVEIEGIKFYGCPWCEGPAGWAFCPDKNLGYTAIQAHYDIIPECDVLLTHQPPKIGNISKSFWWNPGLSSDWGSESLRLAVKDKKIAVSLSGHIHSGNHERTLYPVPGCETVFYNVSLLDEIYKANYVPRYIEIDTETKSVTEIQ